MPRNPDLIRLLMLELEGLDKSAGSIAMLSYRTDLIITGYEPDAVYYHIDQNPPKRLGGHCGRSRINRLRAV